MKGLRKKNYKYHCIECGQETMVLHEIMYGTSNKSISVNYCFQVPLCNWPKKCIGKKYDYHNYYHNYLTKEERWRKRNEWLGWLGYSSAEITNKFKDYKSNKKWFKSVKKSNYNKIMELKI